MRPLKEMVRSAVSYAVVGGGMAAAGRALFPKPGPFILMGHRICGDDEGFLPGVSPELFDEQLRYLTRHYEPLSLADLVETIAAGLRPPAKSFVLTFDDGFRDNYEHALPLLEKYEVPATVFAVTRCLDSGRLPWPQELGFVLQHAQREEVRHALLGPEPVPVGGREARWQIWRKLFRSLRRLGREARDEVIEGLARDLRVDLPEDRMCSWEQAREMQSSGIDIGAHTYSHPWLAEIPFAEACREIERSKADLVEKLGVDRPPFAFPGGSMSSELVEVVRTVGLKSCFQSNPRVRFNLPGVVGPYSLSRIGLPNSPAVMLEAELDGPLHTIRRLYRR